MSYVVIDAPQRSPEWFAARLGRLTGSRAADMLATIKSGEAAARRDYRMQLVCERLTGELQEDGFTSAAMQRGVEKEPDAFAAYEALTGQLVERSGFLMHYELMAGCSLDGMLDDGKGILEIKVPKTATHLKYYRANKVPAEYLPQITHNLWISGADYCDFVSFDDRLPAHLQLFLKRIDKYDVDLAAYELAARLFLSEVQAEIDALTKKEAA